MTEEQVNNIVAAFSEAATKIARALEGLDESARTTVAKLWPIPTGQREAVVTLAETAEVKTIKEQGIVIPKSAVDQWLSEPFGAEDDMYVGQREREFLERQRASSTQDIGLSGPEDGSVEAPEGETRAVGESPTDHPTTQDR